MPRKGRVQHERWDRLKRAAMTSDRQRGVGDSDGQPENTAAPRIFDRNLARDVLRKRGIGSTKLRKAGIHPEEARRLKSGRGIRTLNANLLNSLVKAFPEAAGEITEGFMTVPEVALYVCAARWRWRRASGLPDSDTNDIPLFDESGHLSWVSPHDREWRARRDRDLAELRKRVKEILPSSDVLVVGNSDEAQLHRRFVQEQRALGPLLEWEASGFTERHWTELSAQELYDFMTHGAAERENVLSDRSDDLARIRMALKERAPTPADFRPEHVIPERLAAEVESAFHELSAMVLSEDVLHALPREGQALPLAVKSVGVRHAYRRARARG